MKQLKEANSNQVVGLVLIALVICSFGFVNSVPAPPSFKQAISFETAKSLIDNYDSEMSHGALGNLSLLNGAIDALMKDNSLKFGNSKAEDFGVMMYIIRITKEVAQQHVVNLKNDSPKRYDELVAGYCSGTSSNECEEIIANLFEGQISTLAHLTYLDEPLTGDEVGSNSYIFNVGQLCPPNCPEDVYQ